MNGFYPLSVSNILAVDCQPFTAVTIRVRITSLVYYFTMNLIELDRL